MRVGIDVSAAVSKQRTGVGQYVANMAAALRRAEEAAGIDFVYFSNRGVIEGSDLPDSFPHERIYSDDQARSRLYWMQWRLPRSIRRSGVDYCHFPNYLAPVLGRGGPPRLITIHDAAVYRYAGSQPRKTVVVHRSLLPLTVRAQDIVTTVSESARLDIVDCMGIPKNQVRVVYGGVSNEFTTYSRDTHDLDEVVREKYGLNAPYVLSVGTREPRKNLPRLIEAFSDLVRQERLPHHLVLVGADGWGGGDRRSSSHARPPAARLHVLGYIPGADLPALYRGASAFAFPSLYEGFGLPALEAMACGTPTLISTDPALLEISGGRAALAVNPLAADEIAAGLWRLLSDDGLASALRANGPLRARQFTWERCAAEMMAAYADLAGAPLRQARVMLRAPGGG